MEKKSRTATTPKNLLIVESPAKAKTIEGFLGSDFLVKSISSFCRICGAQYIVFVSNCHCSSISIDIENGYKPQNTVPADKKELVEELRRLSSKAEVVWLASDEDREGEAISWHIFDELNLPVDKTRRIVFHEITKPAILKAIETPRQIDTNLVNAQQARRVLDRLVGYELSPVLWKKVKPSLSAGRVQSVVVRLLVEREREIQNFKSESSFHIVALLEVEQGGKRHIIKAVLPKKLATRAEAEAFLQTCQNARFSIGSIEKKTANRTPASPFTTSTLLQEASRKLGYSVSQTMVLAQKLYEAGKISYMRTDSVNLSKTALDATKAQIESLFGARYYKQRKFANKSKGAQEAHEAIRPTYMENLSAGGDNQEKKLYELIWKRTITSQMADAELEKTVIKINISGTPEQLEAQGEEIVFDGFLRVYSESKDDGDESEDSGLLPAVETGQAAALQELTATQKFASSPPRYTEASLVKKLEELGIGRPSTYAPTISTIQKRNYVVKEDRDGTKRMYDVLTLKNHQIRDEVKSEITGADKNKLFPTDVGSVVNDFLTEHFDQFLNYEFTAKVEMDFDEIAAGNKNWSDVIDSFYKSFHLRVNKALEESESETGPEC